MRETLPSRGLVLCHRRLVVILFIPVTRWSSIVRPGCGELWFAEVGHRTSADRRDHLVGGVCVTPCAWIHRKSRVLNVERGARSSAHITQRAIDRRHPALVGDLVLHCDVPAAMVVSQLEAVGARGILNVVQCVMRDRKGAARSLTGLGCVEELPAAQPHPSLLPTTHAHVDPLLLHPAGVIGVARGHRLGHTHHLAGGVART
mmetsp:Transcript_17674/g.52976  ORF Transcript_17674/g.52976 Transcript_17674/m.52976 type:complete len:203 (-) Transcript_17674:388-996(-)